MELKEKAMNVAALGIVAFVVVQPYFAFITNNTDLNNLLNQWLILLAVVIIGIALLLYGIMFLDIPLPERIVDLIAGIGIIIASIIIILAPLLNQLMKP